jgi:hypothetical protein
MRTTAARDPYATRGRSGIGVSGRKSRRRSTGQQHVRPVGNNP